MRLKNNYILAYIFSLMVMNLQYGFAQMNPISDFFPEIKILESNGPADGYFFMGSKGLTAQGASQYIAILDNFGTPVFFRKTSGVTASIGLLHDGRIAYMHGVPRKLFFMDEMLKVTDIFSVRGFKTNPHDWDVSDNGNVLLIGESTRTVDMTQYVADGNPEAEVLDLIVQEFDPDNNLLFTWNSADHFEITDANEKSSYVNFAEKQLDYVHANAICYDSDTSCLISGRHLDEITKIDLRSGEVIWRLGGKKNQFQFIDDDLRFSHQHSIRKLENGNIILFDNGNLHNPQLSSIIEYQLNEQEKTALLVKRIYRSPPVYCNHEGKVQPLSNGNNVVTWGPYWPSMTEFFPDGSTAIEWDFTKHSFTPRIQKYKWETKIFETNVDTLNFGTWQSDSVFQNIWVKNNSADTLPITTVETRTAFFGIETPLPVKIGIADSVMLKVWFNPESVNTGHFTDVFTIASDIDTQRIARQVKVEGWKVDSVKPFAVFNNEILFVHLLPQLEIKFSEPVTGNEILDYNSIDTYIIFRKNNADGEKISFNAQISSDKTRLIIIPEKTLEESTSYYLSLNYGLKDYSGNMLEPFVATFSTYNTSISPQKTDNSEIRIFPNPASTKITVQIRNNNSCKCKLYNSLGALIQTVELNEAVKSHEFDISGLRSGIYVFVFQTGKKTFVEKIVKH